MEVEEMCSRIVLESGWIERHQYHKVYFYDCVICGTRFVSRRARTRETNKKTCSKKCRKTYDHRIRVSKPGYVWKNTNSKRKRKTIKELIVNTRVNTQLGINGVGYKKACPSHYQKARFVARISLDCSRRSGVQKRVHLGYFDDFFEACCARKSAEARVLKGLPPKVK